MSTYRVIPILSGPSIGLGSYHDQFGTPHNTPPNTATILNVITGVWAPNGELINLTPGVPGSVASGSISCLPNPLGISLNGGAAISITQLPAGFNMSSGLYTPGISAPLTTNTTRSFYGAVSAINAAVVNYPSSFVNLINIMATFFGISWTIIDPNNGEIDITTQLITGNYNTIANSYNIANSGPYAPGDTVTVTATSSLNTMSGINLIWINPATGLLSYTTITQFIFQTPTQLVFAIPADNYPRATFVVEGVSNGTQFSGTVVMGTLTALITNGSGIYQIVPGKTSDTIYNNSPINNTTTEVKIPDPFGKTGFIGG